MTTGESTPVGDHGDVMGRLMAGASDEDRLIADVHLAVCAECRTEFDSLLEWSEALVAVPEQMRLDGPPAGGDLLLQRVLRRARADSTTFRRRRTSLIAAAAAVVAFAAFGTGTLIDSGEVSGTAVAQSTWSVVGSRHIDVADPATEARVSLAVAPADGWVRVHARVSGIPAGQRCRLEVIAKDGSRQVAGSWVVSEDGAGDGTLLDGSAIIEPDDVAGVRVVNTEGKVFVSSDI